MIRFLAVIIIPIVGFIAFAQEKEAMDPADLYTFDRVSNPVVSPGGDELVFSVSEPDLEANGYHSDLWILSAEGGKPRQLTFSNAGEWSPSWSPDGKHIAFLSAREGNTNIFLISPESGKIQQVTNAPSSIHSYAWMPDGSGFICGMRVLPDGKTNIENWTKNELPQCEARTINSLYFRQWNIWLGDKRNHLFQVDKKSGEMRLLTPGEYDVPPNSLASLSDYSVSPDGKYLCYMKNIDTMLAVSTNHDLFLLNLETGAEEKITKNPAWDGDPHFSPDGRYIAYASMEKPGYEADTHILTLYSIETKEHRHISTGLDRSAEEILWAPDSKTIFFAGRDEGNRSIYRTNLTGEIEKISEEGWNTSLDMSPDGSTLYFNRSYNYQPSEIFRYSLAEKSSERLTYFTKDFTDSFALPELEEFWFEGAEGTPVQGFIQKPPNFDPSQKYPLVLCIHGGPQNMWGDRFMTGWFTFQLISSPGYVGLFINPRGSNGYGDLFREQISKNYGTYTYPDLMNGVDYVLQNYSYIDSEKLGAIGGSFGGYAVNWIMGKTDRFDCIVSHASLYNLTSFYGATEELWFPAWDMGETPWDEPELYEKHSPHMYAKNFSTPTLVTHGQMDFRVPFAESLQLFTALQRQGVPSRLVVFPDEGHVIYGPQNNVRWWIEIQRWFEEYLK